MRLEYRFQTSFPLQAPLISFSSTFRYVHPSLCVCVCVHVCVCVWWWFSLVRRRCGSISTAHCPPSGTTGCYQPQPGSTPYNASLPVYVCVSVYMCVCVCVFVWVFSSCKQCFITYLSQGSFNISSCLITQWESCYLFQSYLQSRPLPPQKHAYTCIHMHSHAYTHAHTSLLVSSWH